MIHDTTAELDPVTTIETQPRTILIIDDDDAQSFALAWRLQSQGYETLTSNEGRRGLILAKSERPDVILLDLQLPDMDGLEICEQLSDSSATCGIPVIIVSGSDRSDIVKKSRAAGCDYYLRKPYDPSVVLMLVERAIERLRDHGL